ncbi:energy transducer TonB family protein [Devosia sp. A449]
MQRALSGSVLVHVAVIGAAFVGFSWPEPDDAPAAESVSVSIVTMSSVSANATSLVQSDSTLDLVSAGAAATTPPPIEPIKPDAIEPITEAIAPLPPETQQPINEPAIEAMKPDSVEPVEAPLPDVAEPPPEPQMPLEAITDVAVLTSTALNSLASQPITASPSETIEAVSSEDLKQAPIPQTLSFVRPSKPTNPQSQQQVPRQAATPPPNTAGNGGASNADAAASAGSTAQQADQGNGGDAEIARYPGDVLRKLRRALRSNNSQRGEVVVRFTVLANGQVAEVSIARSSGNSALDQAGLATVGRAAPFPAIPAAANRSSWTFDVPLAFGG